MFHLKAKIFRAVGFNYDDYEEEDDDDKVFFVIFGSKSLKVAVTFFFLLKPKSFFNFSETLNTFSSLK